MLLLDALLRFSFSEANDVAMGQVPSKVFG
jgi:hypothetical protein